MRTAAKQGLGLGVFGQILGGSGIWHAAERRRSMGDYMFGLIGQLERTASFELITPRMKTGDRRYVIFGH